MKRMVNVIHNHLKIVTVLTLFWKWPFFKLQIIGFWFLSHICLKSVFNPLYANGLFLLAWYNKLGIVHCTYQGVSGHSFQKILCFCLKIFFTFTNSADPDEMQHYAAFHLGLHCLQKVLIEGCLEYKFEQLFSGARCLNVAYGIFFVW